MKGAVLHKLGLKLVKWRIMKASYGLVSEPTFIDGQHPERLKFRDKIDGNWRCRDVMKWCARKADLSHELSLTRRAPEWKMRRWSHSPL